MLSAIELRNVAQRVQQMRQASYPWYVPCSGHALCPRMYHWFVIARLVVTHSSVIWPMVVARGNHLNSST